MKIAPLADVKARLSAYVDHVETEGPVVITRNGKPVAVLLAPRDAEDLEQLVLVHSPRFQALLDESRVIRGATPVMEPQLEHRPLVRRLTEVPLSDIT